VKFVVTLSFSDMIVFNVRIFLYSYLAKSKICEVFSYVTVNLPTTSSFSDILFFP
jgi:hypothetical protein